MSILPSGESSFLNTFIDDETFSQFLDSSFDANNFISKSINQNQLSENYNKLQKGIELLQQEINSQVTNHSEELLNQVNVIQHLEHMLKDVNDGVTVLEYSVEQVQHQLNKPYQRMTQQLFELERTQNAMEIMRKMQYFWDMCSKLKTHIGVNTDTEEIKKIILPSLRELPTAASFLFELEKIGKHPDLNGIHLVSRELDWILRVHQEIQNKASQMLVRGLETQNQLEVANSLQVFENLHSLPETIQQTVTIIEDNIYSSVRAVIDFSTLARNSSQPGSQQTAEWKAILWTRMEKFMDVLYQHCVQIWHLQRVLLFKELHIQCNEYDENTLASSFWIRFTGIMKKEFTNAAENSVFIETTFVNDYSRLVHIFSEFLKRLQSHHEVKQGRPVELVEETYQLMNVLEKFEQAYVQNIMDRFNDPIRRAFPKGGLNPSIDEVHIISKYISVQIDVAQNTPQLIPLTMNCIANVIQLCIQNATACIVTEELGHNVEKLQAAQIRNGKLYNVIYQFNNSLLSISSRSSHQIQSKLQASFSNLKALSTSILDLLFKQETNQVERIILSIHHTDYTKIVDLTKDEGSPYIRQLQKQLQQFTTVTLAAYTFSPAVNTHIQKLTDRILLYFVRHAALVRPLSNNGRLRLAGDMAQLESALTSLRSLKLSGPSYQALRAFKQFLFIDLDKVRTSNELTKLQPLDVLHNLICRGSQEIKLPHELLNWSISKYSAWLDQCTNAEPWQVMQKSLDMYARQVDSRGAKQYDPVYPLLIELGPTLIRQNNNK